ncbi:hypothetical protein HOC35_07490 [Candidatus Woesearchaeota archaeon]|jgi:hypothetical protein|nr:hypothetical protein [Candidatus Woesearchaeota archaeon]
MVILFDRFNLPENIYEVVFATDQQKIVGKLLVKEMRKNKSEFTKSEMSSFAMNLHDGKMVAEIDHPKYQGKKVKLSYNKRQFYDRILTPMKGMGLIDYDLYKKTYKISDRFNKAMIKIGLMWIREFGKQETKE